MNLSNNTVLVTGGASGIGLAIVERFLKAGSSVIACGRRPEKLAAAQARCPALVTRVADVALPAERERLASWVTEQHPRLNVLVNNAGIQRRVPLASHEPWDVAHEEIAANLEAPIHLSRLLIAHLSKQASSAVINITSGLAFAPLAQVPIYCATKAALHSFTLSLRHQLSDTAIQ